MVSAQPKQHKVPTVLGPLCCKLAFPFLLLIMVACIEHTTINDRSAIIIRTTEESGSQLPKPLASDVHENYQ